LVNKTKQKTFHIIAYILEFLFCHPEAYKPTKKQITKNKHDNTHYYHISYEAIKFLWVLEINEAS
jgi:hypothetical protein